MALLSVISLSEMSTTTSVRKTHQQPNTTSTPSNEPDSIDSHRKAFSSTISEPTLDNSQCDDIDEKHTPKRGLRSRGMHPYEFMLILACFLLSTGSSVSTILVNKYVYERLFFTLETTLMAIHQLSTALMCQVLVRVDPEVFKLKTIPIKDALQVSVLYALSIVFVNLSLFYSSLGTYQISKLLVAPMILLLNFVLYGRVVRLKILLAISILLLGVFAVELSDVNWKHWRGAAYSCLGILFTAYSQVIISSKHHELNASSFQLLYYQAPISGILLLLSAPLVEGWNSEYNIFSFYYSTKLLAVIGISCTIAFATNFGTFLVIGETSALTYQVLGHVKTLLVILFGTIMFENVPNVNRNIRAFGFILSAIGAVWYSYQRLSSRQDQDNKKPTTVSESEESSQTML